MTDDPEHIDPLVVARDLLACMGPGATRVEVDARIVKRLAEAVLDGRTSASPGRPGSPELPWARHPLERCAARQEPRDESPWFGRCELRRHPDHFDHALERAFDTPRWSTALTGF